MRNRIANTPLGPVDVAVRVKAGARKIFLEELGSSVYDLINEVKLKRCQIRLIEYYMPDMKPADRTRAEKTISQLRRDIYGEYGMATSQSTHVYQPKQTDLD